MNLLIPEAASARSSWSHHSGRHAASWTKNSVQTGKKVAAQAKMNPPTASSVAKTTSHRRIFVPIPYILKLITIIKLNNYRALSEIKILNLLHAASLTTIISSFFYIYHPPSHSHQLPQGRLCKKYIIQLKTSTEYSNQ